VKTIEFQSAKVYWDGQGLPFIIFKDGKATYALPRLPVETESLGYTDVALGNFEHEVLHVFLCERLVQLGNSVKDWVYDSVLARAARGEQFVGENLEDAIFEESLVLGLQVALNNHQRCDDEGNTTLPGFCFHLARGCYMNARSELQKLGVDIDALAAEARTILRGEEPVEGASCPVGYHCLEVPRELEVQSINN
jgi:hypothetical protein